MKRKRAEGQGKNGNGEEEVKLGKWSEQKEKEGRINE